jgi:hypothetical protein
VEKRIPRLGQRPLQPARRLDGAGIPFEVEALDDIEVRFGDADYFADRDVFRGPIEAQPSTASAHAGDDLVLYQALDDLHHVVRRHPVGPAHLLDRDQAIGVRGEIEHQPQRVVREVGQLHGTRTRV